MTRPKQNTELLGDHLDNLNQRISVKVDKTLFGKRKKGKAGLRPVVKPTAFERQAGKLIWKELKCTLALIPILILAVCHGVTTGLRNGAAFAAKLSKEVRGNEVGIRLSGPVKQ